MNNQLLLKMENIKKSYGHVEALKGVDLVLRKGEILGLVGDNAAGKSTLIKILCGAISKDSGKIFIDRNEVNIYSPADARNLRIETVYQQFALVDNLTVYCNIFLGRLEIKKLLFGILPILDKSKMENEALKVLSLMGIKFDSARVRVSDLSGGQRQAVAIARAILFNPRILILDEPTSGLAVKEVEKIQDIIINFKNKGISVLFISHRLESIFATSDRIMVLRSGIKVMDEEVKKITTNHVVEKMFGLESK